MSDEILDSFNELKKTDEDLSLLDEQYSLSQLKNGLELCIQQDRTDSIVKSFVNAYYLKEFGKELKNEIKPKVRYVVENSEELYNAVKNGVVDLDKNKAGTKIYAQIKNGNLYGEKLGIKEELFSSEIDTMQLANALQMKAIEYQLKDIMNVLEEINTDVERIIKGQQNDRVGLYYSGVNLYLEAKGIQDEFFKKCILSNALKSINDANSQMVQNIQNDVQYLLNKEYKKNKGKNKVIIKEKMIDIHKSFLVIHRAFVLKAVIYNEQKEFQAMLTTFSEYGKFLEKVIVPNAQKLREFDENDILMQGGIWDMRAKSIKKIEDMKKQLQLSEKMICIELESEKDVEG